MTVTGDCSVSVNASCVNPPVDRYDWVFDTQNKWQTVTVTNGGPTSGHNWGGSCEEDPESITIRLTVRRGGAMATAMKTVVLQGNDDLRVAPGTNAVPMRFQTHLDIPPFDGSSRGRLHVNGVFVRAVDSSQPVVIQTEATSGTNTLRAVLARRSNGPGEWRFDFRNEPSFVSGSLRVVKGNVLSLEPDAVVVRVTGTPGEQIELSFDLGPLSGLRRE